MKRVPLLLCSVLNIISAYAQKTAPSTPFEVMTYNIRYANDYDEAPNRWHEDRKEKVLQMIKMFNPNILGLQEVLSPQLHFLEKGLKVKLYGVGREDGKEQGEHSALAAFRGNTVRKWGYFWLSETPNQPGKGWDAACERIATWAIVAPTHTKREVLVMNVHLDHVGKEARLRSVGLLLQAIDSLAKGRPAVLMGDFNASPDDPVIKKLTDTGNPLHLKDSRTLSPVVLGPRWSYQEFGSLPEDKRVLIDYIFVRGEIDVLYYAVLDITTGQGNFPSDHCPVVVSLRLK